MGAYKRRKRAMGVVPEDLVQHDGHVKRSERDLFIDDKFKQGFSFDQIEKMLEIRSLAAFRSYCHNRGLAEGGPKLVLDANSVANVRETEC